MKQVELDPFTAEILRDYLITTVEEMVSTTLRSAYSTAFSEGRDFSCAIFDPQGRMVSSGRGVPGPLWVPFRCGGSHPPGVP